MGRDYGKTHASWWNRNKSDSICILPGRCSSQLAEQILTDFANGQDDGLTTDGVGVTQALSKLDFPTGEISGETRSVIRSFQKTLERLYDGESCRTLNWYHPASGRLAMREDADEFEMYDVPLPFLVDEARSRPDRSVWWLSVELYEPGIKDVPIRSVAKSIATEDGWIGVDRDRTVGDLVAMVAETASIGEEGLATLEASARAVAGGESSRSSSMRRVRVLTGVYGGSRWNFMNPASRMFPSEASRRASRRKMAGSASIETEPWATSWRWSLRPHRSGKRAWQRSRPRLGPSRVESPRGLRTPDAMWPVESLAER